MKSFPGDPCPRANCCGVLVERYNKIQHNKFLGCSRYPECDHTEPLEEENE
jgi:ssDNA-binding Zn-finger/Zn-ribbon topoisomerase 1